LVVLVPSPDSSIARRGPFRFPFAPLPCVLARPKPKVAKKQKKRKSMKRIFAFGDEWSDSSDCNSDSSDCYGSDNGYIFTSTNDTEGLFFCLLYSNESESESVIKYPPLLLLMPIFATTEKNITKQNKQDVISSDSWSWSDENFDDCDSSKSECAYKYSSDSSDSSESYHDQLSELITSCLFCFVIFFSVVAKIGINFRRRF
jgi:hypothetical protein